MKINNYANEVQRNGLLSHWLKRIGEIGSLESSDKGYAFLCPFLIAAIAKKNDQEELSLPFDESVISIVNEKKYNSEFEAYILEELILFTEYNYLDLNSINFSLISDSIAASRIKLYEDCVESEFGLVAASKKLNIFLSIIGGSLSEFSIEESYCYGILLCKILDNDLYKPIMEKSLLISDNIPTYYQANLEILSYPETTNHTRDLWLISVVLRVELAYKFKNDQVFQKWFWDFHNFLFYEPGTLTVRSLWNLEDNNFMPTLIRAVVNYLPEYFNQNNDIGIQTSGTRKDQKMTMPDVFKALQQKMRDTGESDQGKIIFTCEGEKINHYCNQLIQGTLVVLSYI